ncbi:MAG: dihydropteroate synthase [Bacteroidales bacterium]
MMKKLIRVKGGIVDLSSPLVMGILNATPDSFFEGCRSSSDEAIERRVDEILSQGGDIIDIGAYSSRPDSIDISIEEEWERLSRALAIVKRRAPMATISIDTFRSEIARRSVEEFGVDMINDISGGELDGEMMPTVARLGVPYIMMHMRGTPQTMQSFCEYDSLITDILHYFSKKIDRARELGISDVIIDPGFGFSKSVSQNYELLAALDQFEALGHPILVGVSRKSMIYRLLDITPADSLNGTTALNMFALSKGASILRVHDVREAVEVVRIHQALSINK